MFHRAAQSAVDQVASGGGELDEVGGISFLKGGSLLAYLLLFLALPGPP